MTVTTPGPTLEAGWRPSGDIRVLSGPLLLAGLDAGPGWEAHVARLGPVPDLSADQLMDLTTSANVRGRGGAGFPFARKLATVLASRRFGRPPVVVVNAAEGEPASAKDSALLRHTPHRVLDGALIAARAVGASDVHVVTSADRPRNTTSVVAALAQRPPERVRWHQHEAEGRFVAGQAQAVLQSLAGRPGLPVTAWVPEAVRGHRGRPTLLSNAETFAQVAALARVGAARYAATGTDAEPGTTLLTVGTTPGRCGQLGVPTVMEVGHGQAWSRVLTSEILDRPMLVGGFHGRWVRPGGLSERTVGNADLADLEVSLGAGVVLALAEGACPVQVTADIVTYLAEQSAKRCGPCRLGLPALAEEMQQLGAGVDTLVRLRELAGLVTGRGACAHPDGTARLVGSLLTTMRESVRGHLSGYCACVATGVARAQGDQRAATPGGLLDAGWHMGRRPS